MNRAHKSHTNTLGCFIGVGENVMDLTAGSATDMV